MKTLRPRCIECHKYPDQIDEYYIAALQNDCLPDAYVMREEGTYNRSNGHFYCTDCYVKIGMPLGVAP